MRHLPPKRMQISADAGETGTPKNHHFTFHFGPNIPAGGIPSAGILQSLYRPNTFRLTAANLIPTARGSAMHFHKSNNSKLLR